MSASKPIIDEKVQLEKHPDKGGWTYAVLPGLPNNTKAFGMKKLNGFIDNYELKDCTLWAMKAGTSFLPVKAEIRKKINKEAGDWVHIRLFADIYELHTPEEFIDCLADEPVALKHYNELPDDEKKKYLDWIFAAKNEELQIERMVTAIDRLATGKMLGKLKEKLL